MNSLFISLAAGIVLCYFVCGIPFGVIISRVEGVDVRKVGSHNIGMTNVARSVGAGAAGLTLAGDALKGCLCMLISRWLIATCAFGGSWSATLASAQTGWISALLYFTCVCGHVFSPYLHFHGGKGISVGFGAGLGLAWPLGLGLLAVFLAIALPTRYVSAGSIFAAVTLPFWGLLCGFVPAAIVPLVGVTCIVVWAHRSNVVKLVHGDERTFSLHHRGEPVEGADVAGAGDAAGAAPADQDGTKADGKK